MEVSRRSCSASMTAKYSPSLPRSARRRRAWTPRRVRKSPPRKFRRSRAPRRRPGPRRQVAPGAAYRSFADEPYPILYLRPRALHYRLIIPHGVIGNTTVFGTVILGSSPGGEAFCCVRVSGIFAGERRFSKAPLRPRFRSILTRFHTICRGNVVASRPTHHGQRQVLLLACLGLLCRHTLPAWNI